MKTTSASVLIEPPSSSWARSSVLIARERSHAERLEKDGMTPTLAARHAHKIILLQDIETTDSVHGLRTLLRRMVDELYQP